MTEITIHNVDDGSTLLVAPITKDATIKQVLMGDWYIEIPFTLTSEIPIPKGSYIVYESQKFEIMDNVYPEYQSSTGGYKYVLKFWAQQNHFKRCKVFYGRDRLSEVTFNDTATIRDFADIVIENISYFTGGDNWRVGEIPEELDIEINEGTARRELISFDGTSCWDAVNLIAQTFEVEWWTNVNATTGNVYLNFGTCKFNTPIDFKQGEVIQSVPAKKGDTSEYGTRFFVYGGTQNLAPDYRKAENEGGVTNHISEKRLCMRDDDGYYVDFIDVRPNLTPAEIVEQVVKFDDIFPKSEETITEVSKVDRTLNVNNENKTFQAYVVTCQHTAYTDSLLMEGETLGCKFTSGVLNGREFELSTDKVGDKQFEIVHITETDGNGGTIILPGGTIISQNGTVTPNNVMAPAVLDTFILTGISLPKENVQEAEKELYHKGLEYAEKNSSDTDVYDCPTNPVYCTENDCNYDVGQAVNLYSTRFKNGYRESRIQGYSKKLYNEYIATYTIGDNSSYSLISAVAKQIKSSEVSSKEYADNIVREANRTSNRRYTDAKQTAQALADANFKYFSDAINPVAVQTMQLLVGDDSLQFELIGGNISYSIATGEISASAATLNHYTVGNNGIDSAITYSENGIKGTWVISEGFSAKPNDATKYYWLYIKASQSDNTAEYLLSETTLPLDGGDGYYYFLVGLLNSEDTSGDRSWTQMYGFTEITPGRVVTEKIQSADGQTWIDLKTGAASFAGDKIKWGADGNVEMQNIKAVDSAFRNVKIEGSLSQPFVGYETKSYIKYSALGGTGSGILYRDIEKYVEVGNNIYIGWGSYYTLLNAYGTGNSVYRKRDSVDPNTGATTTIMFPLGTIDEVHIENNIDGGENSIGAKDNIAIAVTEVVTLTEADFAWDVENSGRVLRIVNSTYDDVNNKKFVRLFAPEDKYFYEDGQAMSSLRINREIVELIGYGNENSFYGWIIKARKDVETEKTYGSPAKVIYQGVIDYTTDTAFVKVKSSYHYNQSKTQTIDVGLAYATATGKTARIWTFVTLPALKGMEDTDNWEVMVTPNPRGRTSDAGFILASVELKEYNIADNTITFRVRCSNVEGSLTSAYTFQVISSADWQEQEQETK